jgi:hypothetical protein
VTLTSLDNAAQDEELVIAVFQNWAGAVDPYGAVSPALPVDPSAYNVVYRIGVTGGSPVAIQVTCPGTYIGYYHAMLVSLKTGGGMINRTSQGWW